MKIGRLVVDVAPLDCWRAYGRPKFKHHELGVILAGVVSGLFTDAGYRAENWLILDGDNTRPGFHDWRELCLKTMERMGYEPDRIVEEYDIKSGIDSHGPTVRRYGFEPTIEHGILSCESAEVVLTDMKTRRGSDLLVGYPVSYYKMYGPNSDFRRERVPFISNGSTMFPFVYPYTPSQQNIRREIERAGYEPNRERESLVRMAVALTSFDQERVRDLSELVGIALRSQEAFSLGDYNPEITGDLMISLTSEQSLGPLSEMSRDGTGNLAYVNRLYGGNGR